MNASKATKIINEATKYLERGDIAQELRRDFADIIAIPNVAGRPEGIYPYGRECARALESAAAMGERYGFKVENHEYHCLSIINGSYPDEIGIVTHLDVVPAGSGWSSDPFRLTERDGMFIGRGTEDDKGPFICSLYALRFLRESGIELPFSVRLIAGSDEEVGSSDLEYFASVRKPPMFSFTPDAEYPVCVGEKGILQVDIMLGRVPDGIAEISGGSVSNAVPDSAFAVLWDSKSGEGIARGYEGITALRLDDKRLKITAEGRGAHAAMPESGKNAIAVLADFLLDYFKGGDEKKIFEFLSRSCGEHLGVTLGIDKKDKAFGYLTCVGSILSSKDGILEQSFNIRYIPDTTYETVLNKIKSTLAPRGFAVKERMHSEGYSISPDDPRIKALSKACARVTGIKSKPYTMGGGTYARWLKNTVAFGAAIPAERGRMGAEKGGAHQRDEYFSEKELKSTVLTQILALMNLAEDFDTIFPPQLRAE